MRALVGRACLADAVEAAQELGAGGVQVVVALELAIERGELRPVLLVLGVQRRDRRVQRVGTAAPERERAIERRAAAAISPASHSERSWSPSRTIVPSRKRASCRACEISISASSALSVTSTLRRKNARRRIRQLKSQMKSLQILGSEASAAVALATNVKETKLRYRDFGRQIRDEFKRV